MGWANDGLVSQRGAWADRIEDYPASVYKQENYLAGVFESEVADFWKDILSAVSGKLALLMLKVVSLGTDRGG